MTRDNSGGDAHQMCWLVKIDLVAHGIAFVSCAAGGLVLESVVLMGAAAHHVASVAFRLLIGERDAGRNHTRGGETGFFVAQLLLWTTCVLLALFVTATGAHGIFHVETIDAREIAGFVVPGVIAALTTAGLALCSDESRSSSARTDALLSAAPVALAVCIAFSALSTDAGRLDALAGIASVLMLCVRALLHLGRAMN